MNQQGFAAPASTRLHSEVAAHMAGNVQALIRCIFKCKILSFPAQSGHELEYAVGIVNTALGSW